MTGGGKAQELAYNGYLWVDKSWPVAVGHRACLGAMVCNETLRTKRESASCSAPLTGSFTCARLDDVELDHEHSLVVPDVPDG